MEVGNLKGMGGPNNNISLGKETRPFAPFKFKMIILPRQARDKHRENSKKDAFLQRRYGQRRGGRRGRARRR